MKLKSLLSLTKSTGRLVVISVTLLQFALGAPIADAQTSDAHTSSPIKHVIIIIGENRSFDHIFATYEPRSGESVANLLAKSIVKLDSKKNAVPGARFEEAHQLAATDMGGKDPFLLSPPTQTFPNDQLPAPLVGGPEVSVVPNQCVVNNVVEKPITQCPASLALAKQAENGLPDSYVPALLSGGTGLKGKVPDTRISNVTTLPAGPFQLTNGRTFGYDDYAASPVHRFYQMFQQLNCSKDHARADNPSGCDGKLFSWVEVTVGAGSNGAAQPPLCSSDAPATPCFTTNYLPAIPKAQTTRQGSTALGFYNMQQGDAPYLKELADKYAMSDNFHQSVHGGTGANHIMLGHGDAIWFSDGSGNPATPPDNVKVGDGDSKQSTVSEIENPDPAPGTNNWYLQDGYGNGRFGSGAFGGGSYSNCADESQPGVKEVVKYLLALPQPIHPRCEPGHYYLLNNYNPGYFGDGSNAFLDTNAANTPFTIPPSSTPSIGDDMNAHNISWKYYGDQWNVYLNDKYESNHKIAPGVVTDDYCNICNPFQFDTSIMASKAQREAHLQDTLNLYADIASHSLPAVSFVKPSGLVDGHPASSKLNLFEGFVKKIVDQVVASPYAKDTAIFITFDEGGGYYDSGYVQLVDFFGDGTRVPLIVVSAYNKPGHIAHNYSDHVSLLKFIERNWNLPPVTPRSRDNFPNPVSRESGSLYVPLNSPAISDLFELFDFDRGNGRKQ
ncbi:MAG TPA: alkaline phosphatase family protein [Candidatus Dormibacteraeota bacterium]|nr:alkaline phosphatase family protein [Candidatus Dormibacteraeota bacterium]